MRSKCLIFFFLSTLFLHSQSADAQVKAVITSDRIIKNDTIYVCQGGNIRYDGISSLNTTGYSFTWTFDGGVPNTSNAVTPNLSNGILYTAANTYKTKLVLRNNLNPSDSVTASLVVVVSNSSPSANFNFTKAEQCANIADTFINTSSGIGLSYRWNFGDGGTSTQQNPVHQFSNAIGMPGPRTYSVSLVVTDYFGCTSNPIIEPVTVRNMPDAKMGNPDPTVQVVLFNGDSTFRRCTNLPFYNFSFTNLSTTIGTNISDTIRWGDTSTDTVFSPWNTNLIVHSFPFGVNDLSRFVVANDGCMGMKKYKVFLGNNPASVSLQILGSGSVFCTGTPYDFPLLGTGVLENAPGTNYTITFSDSTVPPLIIQHPPQSTVPHTFEYSSCGKGNNNDFEARVLIQNPCGLTGPTVLPSLYVSDRPKPSISFSPGDIACVDIPVIIVDSSIDNKIVDGGGNCTVGDRFWSITPGAGWALQAGYTFGNEFGFPVISGSKQLNISYNSPGFYTIKLKKKGSPDCGDSSNQRFICINPNPRGSFKLSDSIRCAPFYDTAVSNINTPNCGRNRVRWSIDNFQPTQGCLPGVSKYSFQFGTTRYSDTPIIYFENAGIYRVRMEVIAPGDSTACIFDTSMLVTVKGKPNIRIIADTVLCINNSTQPTVTNRCDTAGSSSHWTFTGTSISSFDGFNPPSLVYPNPGLFTIIDSVANICPGTIDTVLVRVVAPVLPNAGPDTFICSGSTITIGQGPAVPGVVYSWSSAPGVEKPDTTVTNITLNSGLAGTDTTYQFVITASIGSNSSCKLSDTVNITVRKSPVLTGNVATPVCLGSGNTSSTLVVSGADTYSWSPLANIIFNTIQDTAIVSPSITTTFVVVGSLLNGCKDTFDFIVPVGLKPFLGVDIDTASCSGQTINLNGLYNTAGLTSLWAVNGNPVSNPALTTQAGTYTLVAADNIIGCADTAVALVSFNPKPNIGRDTAISLCNGSFIKLDTVIVSSNSSVKWFFNNQLLTNTLINTTGVYTAITTNASFCSDTAMVTILPSVKPSLGADKDTAVCRGTFVDLTNFYATTGFTPSWTFNGSGINPASVAAPGTYQLIAGTNAGCSDTAIVSIIPKPKPDLGPDTTLSFCIGNTVNINAPFDLGGLVYFWTKAGVAVNSPSAINAPGMYRIVAFNSGFDCSDTAFVIVGQFRQPMIGGDQTINVCNGQAVNLTLLDTTTGFISAWTLNGNPLNNPDAVKDSGIYRLVVSTPGGSCTDTGEFKVIVNPNPYIGARKDTLLFVCPYQTADLTGLFNDGGQWSSESIPVNLPGSVLPGKYKYTVTNQYGCRDSGFAVVQQKLKPAIGKDTVKLACEGTPVNLNSFYITNGLTPVWTYYGNTVGTPSSVTNSGDYLLVVSNAGECTDTAMVRVIYNPNPRLGSNKTFYQCEGDTIDISNTFPITGILSVWSSNSNPVPPPTGVTSFGVYQLTAIDIITGCRDTAEATVFFNTKPNLGPDVEIADTCEGTYLNLNSFFNTAGLSVSWTLGGAPVLRPDSILVTVSTTYRVVADNNGCMDTAFLAIGLLNPLPDLGRDTQFIKCPPDSISLFGLYGGAYSTTGWTTLSGRRLNASLVTDSSGIYQLVVSNRFGCFDTAIVKFVLKPKVFANAGSDINGISGVPQRLHGSGGMTYLWQPGRPLLDNDTLPNPLATLSNTTTFSLIVSDTSDGKICSDTDKVKITIFDGIDIHVPTAFTPDKEPNRLFFPVYVGIKSIEFFRIYNRWGNLVFETTDMNAKWDGTYKSKPQDFGNYVWHIRVLGNNGRKIEKKGNVVLLR